MKYLIIYSTFAFLCFLGQLSAAISGNIYYEKTIHSDDSSTGLQQDVFKPLIGAKVALIENSSILEETTISDNGYYHFSANPDGNFQITVYSSNDNIEIGSQIINETATGVYTKSATDLSGNGPHDISISIEEDSGAFNIFHQFNRGMTWTGNFGYSITEKFKVKWPGIGSFFEPDNFTFSILGDSNDPDEFDDDIILHEFSHGLVESISIDHSLGGFHSIVGQLDLRLAWSEGLATFLGQSIQNNPSYSDTLGSTQFDGTTTYSLQFSIDSPSSSAVQSSNEWAVSYVLWNASQQYGIQNVIDTLAAFKTNSTKVNDEQATLDIFHDLWNSGDLETYYLDREIYYQTDDFDALNTVSQPADIGNYQNLTFYPSGNNDYFKFSADSGDEIAIETDNLKNGALTSIKLYQSFGDTLILVDENSPADKLFSDTTSKIDYTLTSTGDYIIEISRFNSDSENFGLGSSDGYTKTAGVYGSYDVDMTLTDNFQFPYEMLYSLNSSSDNQTIEDVFISTIDNFTSINLSSRIKSFGNIVDSSLSRRDFNVLNNGEQSTLSTIYSHSSSNTYMISDNSLPLSISNVPAGNTLITSILPISSEPFSDPFSFTHFITIDLLDNEGSLVSQANLNIEIVDFYDSTRHSQLMVQNGTSFDISIESLPNTSDNNISFSLQEPGVLAIRQLVTQEASASDKASQLKTLISITDFKEMPDALSIFKYLVDRNQPLDSFTTNDNLTLVAYTKTESLTSASVSLASDGNIQFTNLQDDSTLIWLSQKNELKLKKPENQEPRLYLYSVQPTMGNSITSSSLQTTLLDSGRNDFDYYLHNYNNNSLEYLTDLDIFNLERSFTTTTNGIFAISSNVNSNKDLTTLEFVLDNFFEQYDSLTELNSSTNQILAFRDLGPSSNISTDSDHTIARVLSLTEVQNESEVIKHQDDIMSIQVQDVPQGNIMLILTIPSEEEPNIPENSVGKLLSIDLFSTDNESITEGFTLPITFEGYASTSNVLQELYVQDPDTGTFSNTSFSSNTSGNDLIFYATHFSVFSLVRTSTGNLVEEDSSSENDEEQASESTEESDEAVTENDSTEETDPSDEISNEEVDNLVSNNSSGGGGGGGGCLIKR